MGEKYKTELESELEKAFRYLEAPFHEFKTDLVKELLDNFQLEKNIPKGIWNYLNHKIGEYRAAKASLNVGWNESFAEIICEGMFSKKGNFFKQRFAEVNGFMIDYKPIINNIEEVEKAYADNSVAEKLIVTHMKGGTPEGALYLTCLDCNVRMLEMAKSYNKEFPQFARYKKGERLDAELFVKDLIKMLGV